MRFFGFELALLQSRNRPFYQFCHVSLIQVSLITFEDRFDFGGFVSEILESFDDGFEDFVLAVDTLGLCKVESPFEFKDDFFCKFGSDARNLLEKLGIKFLDCFFEFSEGELADLKGGFRSDS